MLNDRFGLLGGDSWKIERNQQTGKVRSNLNQRLKIEIGWR